MGVFRTRAFIAIWMGFTKLFYVHKATMRVRSGISELLSPGTCTGDLLNGRERSIDAFLFISLSYSNKKRMLEVIKILCLPIMLKRAERQRAGNQGR